MEIEFAKDDKRDYVLVPKAMLWLCLDLLIEFENQPYIQRRLMFNEDMALAIAQLRVAIAD